ncbi:hypothetical protein OsJ_01868 [Oryza sativa Japonica Group]|uniref:Uncharacterized protein n=1 Tax=Oryza sativa subsp. japonica TaxID=39947 RepID=A2ZTE2_ORYSJ|nr:hypothetical protein OsJ_01868 [Oryza sativa Japonica Group]
MLDEVYYAIANKTSRLGFPESVSLTVGISGYLSGGGFDLMLRKHTASPSTTSTTPPWWTPREGSSTGRHGGGPLLGHPRRRRRKLRDRLVLEAPACPRSGHRHGVHRPPLKKLVCHQPPHQVAARGAVPSQRRLPPRRRAPVPRHTRGPRRRHGRHLPGAQRDGERLHRVTWIQFVLYFVFYSTGKPSEMLLDRGNGIGDPLGSWMRLARSS